MKLIVTVVDNKDVDNVMSALTGQQISVTRFSSTGGLLDSGNSTLLIGIDEERVPQAMKIVADLASVRQSFMPYTYEGTLPLTGIAEIQVGGFLAFVLNVDRFEQV
ncbi:MAG: cyclic-di-AMP receptor [Anaerolineae bacterium]|nr:cyclic-di-AMP receptor [Anaerolineae bacterium]